MFLPVLAPAEGKLPFGPTCVLDIRPALPRALGEGDQSLSGCPDPWPSLCPTTLVGNSPSLTPPQCGGPITGLQSFNHWALPRTCMQKGLGSLTGPNGRDGWSMKGRGAQKLRVEESRHGGLAGRGSGSA